MVQKMATLKLTAIGTSTGIVIPKDMLARLGVSKGDALYVTETPDGGYHLTAYDPGFAAKMDKAEVIMKRYRNTLAVLAK
jgi:putative addiction module antidote